MLPTIVATLLWITGGVVVSGIVFTLYVYVVYSKIIDRIFKEKPLLIADSGQPDPDSQTVTLRTADGRRVVGSYLTHTGKNRRGVILFLHEFGANRWLASSYVGPLRSAGYDLFTIDFCGHGDSDPVPNYEPLHWPTEHEVADAQAAMDYLRRRAETKDAVAVFGVSKGGGVALVAAAREPIVRAVVTDGAFPIFGMVVHFSMKWVEVYSQSRFIYAYLPRWYYAMIVWMALRRIARAHRVRYPSIEGSLRRFAGRPLLMIVGQRDSYVRKEVVDLLFGVAGKPKELWRVKKAKHNGCLEAAGEEYHRRVLEFLNQAFPDTQPSEATGGLALDRRAS